MEDTKAALWRNLSAAMTRRYGRDNLSRLARESAVGPATLWRIKGCSTSVGTDVLERIAEALGTKPWALLIPEIEGQPPRTAFSGQALDLAESLDSIRNDLMRAQAFALAMHAIHAIAAAPTGEPAPAPTPKRQTQK